MLIKKTAWLKLNNWRTGYWTSNLWICVEQLEEVFDIPRHVPKVRFHLYDRPAKNRIKCRINGLYLFIGKHCVYVANYLPLKLRVKLAQRKHLYLECEYIESDTKGDHNAA